MTLGLSVSERTYLVSLKSGCCRWISQLMYPITINERDNYCQSE
jgi:hypothetical protein